MTLGLGLFYITRLTFTFSAAFLMSKFGKPNLVRETSKISSRNYFALPYLYGKKFVQQQTKRTEKDLLEGVILEKNLED